jgi:hypothetical protein
MLVLPGFARGGSRPISPWGSVPSIVGTPSMRDWGSPPSAAAVLLACKRTRGTPRSTMHRVASHPLTDHADPFSRKQSHFFANGRKSNDLARDGRAASRERRDLFAVVSEDHCEQGQDRSSTRLSLFVTGPAEHREDLESSCDKDERSSS